MTAEELEKVAKLAIPNNSVVIIQVPEKKIPEISQSLFQLSKNLAHRGILFLACPKAYKITVCPQGADVNVNEKEINSV